MDKTNGTFKITARDDEQKSYSGNLSDGSFTTNSGGRSREVRINWNNRAYVSNTMNCSIKAATFSNGGPCSTPNDGGASNPVTINTHYVTQAPAFDNFNGVVECSFQAAGGDTTTQPSSSSLGGGSQDVDGDGILDANDNCPNLPHTR